MEENKNSINICNDTAVWITIEKFTLKTRHGSLFKIGRLRKDSALQSLQMHMQWCHQTESDTRLRDFERQLFMKGGRLVRVFKSYTSKGQKKCIH